MIHLRRAPTLAALLSLFALSACGAKAGNNGGSTSWLTCDDDTDCPSLRCEQRRCVPPEEQVDAIVITPTKNERDAGDATSEVPAEAGAASSSDSGSNPPTVPSVTPTPEQPTGTPLQLVSGDTHSCARFDDGSVWCWGTSAYGQTGRLEASDMPIRVPLDDVEFLAAGHLHTCAATTSKEIYCWGDNRFGQIAPGGLGGPEGVERLFENQPQQVEIEPLQWTDLVAGAFGTCAIVEYLEPYCWGTDSTGTRQMPEPIMTDLPIVLNVQIADLGMRFFDGNGGVQQLARWSDVPEASVDIGTSTHFMAIYKDYDCRIKDTADIWCQVGKHPFAWQPNLKAEWGDLSIGSGDICTIQRVFQSTDDGLWDPRVVCAPVYLPGSEDIAAEPVAAIPAAKQLSGGEQHRCIVGYDKSIWCWGKVGSRESLEPYQLSQAGGAPPEEPFYFTGHYKSGETYVNLKTAAHQRNCVCDPEGPECTDIVTHTSTRCIDNLINDDPTDDADSFDCLLDRLATLAASECEAPPPAECAEPSALAICTGAVQVCPEDPEVTFAGELRCDGKEYCPGGSDEFNCDFVAAAYFRCANDVQEIPVSEVCDGTADCTDESDEINCSTF